MACNGSKKKTPNPVKANPEGASFGEADPITCGRKKVRSTGTDPLIADRKKDNLKCTEFKSVSSEGTKPRKRISSVGANPPKNPPIYVEPDPPKRVSLVGANPPKRHISVKTGTSKTVSSVVADPLENEIRDVVSPKDAKLGAIDVAPRTRTAGTQSLNLSRSGTQSFNGSRSGTQSLNGSRYGTQSLNGSRTGTHSLNVSRSGIHSSSIPPSGTHSPSMPPSGTQSSSISPPGTLSPGIPSTVDVPFGIAVTSTSPTVMQSNAASAVSTRLSNTPTIGTPVTAGARAAVAPVTVVPAADTPSPIAPAVVAPTVAPAAVTTSVSAPIAVTPAAVAPSAIVPSTVTPTAVTRATMAPTTIAPAALRRAAVAPAAVAPAAVEPFTTHTETRSTGAIGDGTLDVMTICKNESGQIVCPASSGSYESQGRFSIMSWLKNDRDMPLPYYADLGKKSNDVFGKGYHFGIYKLDLKTKSEAGVEFTSGITSNHESGKVFGSLSSKYAVKDYGLTFTEKWNTDNTLATDITIQDKIAAGLKVTLEGTFAPQTGAKSGKLKTSFANTTVAVNTSLDLDLAGPIVDVAVVLGQKGWLAGFQSQFDTQKTKFTKNNFSLGYQAEKFELNTNVDNGKDFGGSIYQKVSDKLDCGINMKWTAGSADTMFGVGVKHTLDGDASLHAKINNKSLIGLGYQQKLRPGVVITLSAAIDGQNFNAGGHKVGIALELEP